MSLFDVNVPALRAEPLVHSTSERSEPEVEFDEMARLACSVCRTPLAMVMLLDEQRQWYKASGNRRIQEPVLSEALCEWALLRVSVESISDLTRHEHFQQDSQVVADPKLRFFAGVAILSRDRQAIGILCAADVVPRVLTSDQEEGLELLSKQLQARIELRAQRRELQALIQQKDRTAASLAAGEELFRAFMNASPFLSYIKDAAGRLLFYNQAFAQRFGVGDRTWLGRNDDQLWGRELSVDMRLDDVQVMSGGRMVEAEERLRGDHGGVSYWKTYKFPCRDSFGNLLLAGVAVDMTEEVTRKAELERYQQELEEANDQLRRLSVTDELTGLRNRRAFEERLTLEFSVAQRRRRSLSVLLLDVDFFKKINDLLGHAAGDAVLRRLSAALKTTVRLPDLVARYGGEEFAVLVPESGIDAALGLAHRLMERIAAESWSHEPVTVSIGVATMTDDMVNSFDLVENADKALYAAKRAGRNRAVVYGGEG